MHVDLCGIRDLLAADRELDALKAEAKALADAVGDAREALAAAETALEAAIATREAAVRAERALNRRLDDYVGKRDRTRRLIDAGEAPDFAAAQKQFDQCATIVGDLEDELLEAMGARETAEAAEAGARRGLTRAREAVEARRGAQRDRRPAIEARYKALQPVRAAAAEAVTSAQLGHYTILRTRGQPVLVDIVGGACENCHVAPPPQTEVEVLREGRVHNCRSCHCWFREVVEPDDTVDADE